MKISSPAFGHNTPIPDKYTCKGEDVNPPLTFTDVPANAKSLTIIMDDPDAPSKVWEHWIVYNISPTISEVTENTVPKGSVEGMNDSGKMGYHGPCPPSGTHRYFFKLYALDTMLDLPDFADKAMLEEVMQGHILAQAELIGLYSKK